MQVLGVNGWESIETIFDQYSKIERDFINLNKSCFKKKIHVFLVRILISRECIMHIWSKLYDGLHQANVMCVLEVTNKGK